MYYILFYKTVENYTEKRIPYRDEHLAYARQAHEKGELIMAGALDNPADGAVLIFRCENEKTAEDFAKNDIYVRQGLIQQWQVRKWNPVIGTDNS
jgi:hypothetical protein